MSTQAVTVERDLVLNEFRVFPTNTPRERREAVTYFTDNRDDARGTAEHIAAGGPITWRTKRTHTSTLRR